MIAEYDTSNPDANARVPSPVKSRFNFGLNYHLSDTFQIGLAYERGTNYRLSFSLRGDFIEDTIPKPPPKNIVSLNQEQKNKISNDPGIFYRSLNKSLRDEGIYIQSASLSEEEVSVAVASTRLRNIPRLAGRSTAIISALAPDSVNRVNVHIMNGDLETATLNLNLEKFKAAKAFKGSATEVLKRSGFDSNSNKELIYNSKFNPTVNFPEFSWNMSPALKHQIGGPEGVLSGSIVLEDRYLNQI